MENLFFHDSRQKKYRSIFGAAPTGARVTLRLDVFWQETEEVLLHLFKEGNGTKESLLTMIGLPAEFVPRELTEKLIEYLYSRRATTVVVPMQDLLALPASCRMNIPGTATGNWHWQLEPEQLAQAPAEFLRKLCDKYQR